FLFTLLPPPRSTLFPYTTLFRSFQRVVKVVRVSTGENPVVCVICAMKPRHNFVSKVLLILAFLCAISISTVAQGSPPPGRLIVEDRKSTRLNSSHLVISYAVFCL